jgi:hypothetical protein
MLRASFVFVCCARASERALRRFHLGIKNCPQLRHRGIIFQRIYGLADGICCFIFRLLTRAERQSISTCGLFMKSEFEYWSGGGSITGTAASLTSRAAFSVGANKYTRRVPSRSLVRSLENKADGKLSIHERAHL